MSVPNPCDERADPVNANNRPVQTRLRFHLNVRYASKQAQNRKGVQLEAAAQGWDQVHKGVCVVDGRPLGVLKSRKHPGLCTTIAYVRPVDGGIRCTVPTSTVEDITSQFNRGMKLITVMAPHLMPSDSSSSSSSCLCLPLAAPVMSGKAEMPISRAMARLTVLTRMVSSVLPEPAKALDVQERLGMQCFCLPCLCCTSCWTCLPCSFAGRAHRATAVCPAAWYVIACKLTIVPQPAAASASLYLSTRPSSLGNAPSPGCELGKRSLNMFKQGGRSVLTCSKETQS